MNFKPTYVVVLACTFIISVTTIHRVKAQNPFLDSLRLVLQDATDTDHRRKLMWKIGTKSLYEFPDSTSHYVDLMESEGTETEDGHMLAKSHHLRGILHDMSGEYQQAKKHLQKAVDYFERIDPGPALVRPLYVLGIVHARVGEDGEALDCYFRALKIAEENGNKDDQADLHNAMAASFEELRQTNKALTYYLKAAEYFNESHKHRQLGSVYYNVAGVYFYNKDLDSVKLYTDLANQAFEKAKFTPGVADVNAVLSQYYSEKKQYPKALEAHKKSMAFYEKTPFKARIAALHLYEAEIYTKMNQSHEALQSLDKGMSIGAETGDSRVLYNGWSAKSKIYEKLSQYKEALEANRKLIRLKDTIMTQEQIVLAEENDSRYEKAKDQAEIAEQKLVIQQAKTRNNILIGSLAFLALLFASWYFSFKQSQKAKTLLAEKNFALEKEKVDNLEKREKLLALEYLVQGQEEERQRIAQDLHDGLGGLLSTVKAHIGNIQQEVTALEQVNVVQKTNDLVDHACEEVRRISHNMMPSSMRLGGLKQGVQEIIVRLQSAHDLDVQASINGLDTPLKDNISIVVFRILQELTNNIVKHAHAESVIFQVHQYGNELNLLVEDDGKGFIIDANDKKIGMGLNSVESRVKYLNGSMDVVSNLGQGTSISINIPLA